MWAYNWLSLTLITNHTLDGWAHLFHKTEQGEPKFQVPVYIKSEIRYSVNSGILVVVADVVVVLVVVLVEVM